MPFQDFAQTLPGVVAAAFLPGFALATLLAPTWRAWQRLAMAPGLSAGLIGVYGLALHDVHLPFEPLTVLPVLVVLVVGALMRWRRSPPAPSPGHPWWLPIPALIVGVTAAGVFAWALHGQVLPPDWDSPTHAAVVNAIVRTHDVLPLFPIPLEGSDFVRARPGFEATAAVVSWLGAPSPAAAMTPIITATLVVLPLSLTFLTLEATDSVALAAVVPFFAIGLIFPGGQAIIGRFPEIVDSTLIVPIIVASLRVIRGRSTRENAMLLGAITTSIWVIHGLEVITALVIACGLLAAAAVKAVRASPRNGVIRLGVALGAALAGAAFVTVLTRIPHVPTLTRTQPPQFVLATTHMPLKPHHILVLIAQTDVVGPVALLLYCVGAVAMLIRRRMLWVLVAQGLLFLLMADDLYLHYLHRIWNAIYPWGDTDRVLGIQYWLIPLVLAFGLFAIGDVIRTLSRTRRVWLGVPAGVGVLAVIAYVVRRPLEVGWTNFWEPNSVVLYPVGPFNQMANFRQWFVTLAVAAIVVFVAWIAALRRVSIPGAVRDRLGPVAQKLDGTGAALGVLALIAVVSGAAAELGYYGNEVATRSLVTPADLSVLSSMSSALPKGSLVLTNGGDDAGMWLAGLTDLNPLVPNGYSFGTLDVPFETALEDACTHPAAAEAAAAQADAVFVGSLRIASPFYPWNVNCIARLPNLRLIASAPWGGTIAAGFIVIK
ncbi:MAG: DUF6541 family protein [Candidatus Dormibacteria bacterium]